MADSESTAAPQAVTERLVGYAPRGIVGRPANTERALSFRGKLAIDVIAFIAYLAASNTRLTGIPVHEWLSIGVALVFALHMALNWDWTVKVLRRFVRKLLSLSRFNLVVDVLLFIAFLAIMLTGLMVSRVVVPMLGLSVPFGPTWRILHSISAKLLLLVLGLHVGIHWRWIVNATKRAFTGTPANRQTTEPVLESLASSTTRANVEG